ncbi:MAG TPA: lytic transglycosylase domain-containing protein [Streptosporangiaceae bacterium]
MVVVIGVAAYLVGVRPGNNSTMGAIAAVAAVPASPAIGKLEKERQQLIAMSDASRVLDMVGQPAVTSRQQATSSTGSSSGGSTSLDGPPAAPPNPGSAQAIAYNMMSSFGWNPQTYFSCLNNIWTRESGWVYTAENPSGAYGIPQALPGDKMASAGPDWQTDPTTQIKWGLGYIQARYNNPCEAWAFWQGHDYY